MRCNSARVGLGAVKVPGPTSWVARSRRVRKLQDLSHQVQRRGQRQYPTIYVYKIINRYLYIYNTYDIIYAYEIKSIVYRHNGCNLSVVLAKH